METVQLWTDTHLICLTELVDWHDTGQRDHCRQSLCVVGSMVFYRPPP